MALNDRLKLRSMVIGEKDDKIFIASEEAAIRAMEPDAENIYAPAGGEPVTNCMRLSFGAVPPEKIRTAIERLGGMFCEKL